MGSTLVVSGFVSLPIDGEVEHTAQLCVVLNTCPAKVSFMIE